MMTHFPTAPARIAAAIALAALVAAPVDAASINAPAKVSVVKTITLSVSQDLDFGQVLMPALTGSVTVTVSPNGTRSCPSPLTCSGTPKPALLTVTGSKGKVVLITALATDLVNSVDGSTIHLTPIAPASVTLPNSGNKGIDFNVGGSIDIPSTAAGDYSGEVQITADYQ